MKTKEDPRHQARVTVLQRLFEQEFNKKPAFSTDEFVSSQEKEIDKEFYFELMDGVQMNVEAIDVIIKQYIEKRSFEDTNKIDLLILRIAIFEMMLMHPQTPVRVAIDEAVELAKAFGSNRSFTFVNGVLGTISKQING